MSGNKVRAFWQWSKWKIVWTIILAYPVVAITYAIIVCKNIDYVYVDLFGNEGFSHSCNYGRGGLRCIAEDGSIKQVSQFKIYNEEK